MFRRMNVLTLQSMFFNSVQNFDSWKDYFDSPSDHLLGLLAALYQIGSLASIPIVYVIGTCESIEESLTLFKTIRYRPLGTSSSYPHRRRDHDRRRCAPGLLPKHGRFVHISRTRTRFFD